MTIEAGVERFMAAPLGGLGELLFFAGLIGIPAYFTIKWILNKRKAKKLSEKKTV